MTKRILTVALAALMLLSVAFAASAQAQVTQVKVRGTVADAMVANNTTTNASWDYSTFAGFFYDIKNNISTETMVINDNLADLQSTRIIPKDDLVYTTTGKPLQFKMNEKEGVNVSGDANYTVVGWQAEKWIGVNGVTNKIAKLALEMDKEDKKTLTTGETWSLGSGYELTINAVDARASPRQVWFTLKKDGAVVDEGIGQSPASGDQADKQKAVYYKTKTILGESDALLFTVYVDSIFSGATSDMVQFKYAWLIDESSAKEIQGSDEYGVFEVTGATSTAITMDNKNTVSLSKNTDTTLMGNLVFSIADNDHLRFYPQVTYKDPGNYEVRGSIADALVANNTTTNASWDASNFAGFFYDLKNNISTETMVINDNLADLQSTRIIPKDDLVYATTGKPLQFKMNEKEGVNVSGDANYTVVGWQAEKWIGVNGVSNKIAKLALEMDKEDKKTLTTGETWSLGSGYELTINAVDARASPRQVWFTLKKDGAVVDEGIGQSPASGDQADKQKAVYYKTKTILGESDALLFTVYVDSIFSGATSDMVQFKYAWLIDESSAKEIQGSDEYGVFEVTGATSTAITMDNKNTVSLSKNTDTTLMGNLKFKIADSDVLRFYPKVDYVIGPGGNVTVTGATAKPTVKVTGNKTTTLTAVPTTPKPIETPAAAAATTAKPAATTPKEPGFEAVFAIAGLLAVAYIVLRQRK